MSIYTCLWYCLAAFVVPQPDARYTRYTETIYEIEHSAPSGPPGSQGVVCLIPKVVLGIRKRGYTGQTGTPGSRGKWVFLDQLDQRDHLDLLDHMDQLYQKDHQALLDHLDGLEIRELLDQWGKRGTYGPTGPRGPSGPPGPPGPNRHHELVSECSSNGFQFDEGTSTCIKLVSTNGTTWEDARNYCQQHEGGDLVSIVSKEKWDFIFGNFSDSGALWIGLKDKTWLTGESFGNIYEVNILLNDFDSGYPSEPNSCGILRPSSTTPLQDENCNIRERPNFLCEIVMTP